MPNTTCIEAGPQGMKLANSLILWRLLGTYNYLYRGWTPGYEVGQLALSDPLEAPVCLTLPV